MPKETVYSNILGAPKDAQRKVADALKKGLESKSYQCQNPVCLEIFQSKKFKTECPSCGQVNHWRGHNEAADFVIADLLNE